MMRTLTFLMAVATGAQPAAASATTPARPALPDISGAWARAQITTAMVDIPLVGEMPSRTLAVTRLRVRQQGANVVLDEEVCRLTTQAPTRLVSTTYPTAFLRAVSGNQRRGRLERDGKQIRYVEPKQAYWRGMRPGTDVSEALPIDATDPRIEDLDRDGKPGLTVKVGGLIDGEVFLVQRSWSELRGELRSNDRIEGRVAWSSEERIVGASRSLLTSSPKKRPDDARSFFRMRRIPSAVTCRDILARQRTLFGL